MINAISELSLSILCKLVTSKNVLYFHTLFYRHYLGKIEKVYHTEIETVADKVKLIAYRPFGNRFAYFDTKLIARSSEKIMQHFIKGENVVGKIRFLVCEDTEKGVGDVSVLVCEDTIAVKLIY